MHKSHRRSTKVCTRCRHRKTKCDFKFPQCTPCELAKATCLGFDPTTRQAVSRSLIKSLETRVAELEAQLLAFQTTPQQAASSVASSIGQATISFGLPQLPGFLQSKISPSLIIRPSCPPLAVSATVQDGNTRSSDVGLDGHDGQQPGKKSRQPSRPYTSNPVDLTSIPHWALHRMIRNYADIHLPQYPLIPETLLSRVVERTIKTSDVESHESPGSEITPFEYFIVFIVLAISALTMTWKDEPQARAASESFYKSALKHLQLVDDPSEIKSLQISLLLAQFAHMCPERVDNWACIASAVRIVLALGLHLEFNHGIINAEEAKIRSDLFWVTYGMERSLCSILRLPLSFPEEAITATLKDHALDQTNGALSEDDVRKKSSANHIYRYRALETEMHRFLYLEEDLTHYNETNVADWILDIEARLDTWYTTAQVYRQYNMLQFQNVQYNHLRLRIHRPTPRLKIKTSHDWATMLHASELLIEDYVNQDSHRTLLYPWHGVHILFETAVIALYASWSSRAHPLLRTQALNMLQTLIPQSLQVMVNVGQRWNEAARCVDKIQSLVSRVSASFTWAAVASDVPLDEAMGIDMEINSLLFSNKSLAWNPEPFGDINFGLQDGNLLFDNVLAEDFEFDQWAPDWTITMDSFL